MHAISTDVFQSGIGGDQFAFHIGSGSAWLSPSSPPNSGPALNFRDYAVTCAGFIPDAIYTTCNIRTQNDVVVMMARANDHYEITKPKGAGRSYSGVATIIYDACAKNLRYVRNIRFAARTTARVRHSCSSLTPTPTPNPFPAIRPPLLEF